MKVYVVTEGEYSDYCIDKVFIDKKKAMAYVSAKNGDVKNKYCAFYRIEEYETSDEKIQCNVDVKEYFRCRIFLKKTSFRNKCEIDEYIEKAHIANRENTFFINGEYFIDVFSTNGMEHAKKVAIEQYQIFTQNELENN